MPFKSQAQRRKFAQLLVEGKISNETFEEWNRETGPKKLPERVGTNEHCESLFQRGHVPPWCASVLLPVHHVNDDRHCVRTVSHTPPKPRAHTVIHGDTSTRIDVA